MDKGRGSHYTPPKDEAMWWLPIGFAFTATAYSIEYCISSFALGVALLGFELPQSSLPGTGSASPAPLSGGPPPPTPPAFAGVAICLRDERRGESGRRVGKKAAARRGDSGDRRKGGETNRWGMEGDGTVKRRLTAVGTADGATYAKNRPRLS